MDFRFAYEEPEETMRYLCRCSKKEGLSIFALVSPLFSGLQQDWTL